MKLRLVPAGMALLAVLLAVNLYLKPTAPDLSLAQGRLQADEVQLATLSARAHLLPRIAAERHAIAARLGGLHALDAPLTEAHVLTDLTALAQRSGVTLAALTAKGPATALAPAATPTPAAQPPTGAPPAPAGAGEINSAVPGARLPRAVTVTGGLPSILRFIDGLGGLPDLVRVGGVSLAQTQQLRATIDFEVLVIDPASLRGALHG